MQLAALTRLILGISLVTFGGTLFAADIDDLRERVKAMRVKAAELAERGNTDQAELVEKESTKLLEMVERLEAKQRGMLKNAGAVGIDQETMRLKERLQDLLNKERAMRNAQAAESELMKVRGEIGELEQALKKLHSQHSERVEHRPEFHAQIEKLEKAGQRLQQLRVAAEHLKMAEEHDLAHKVMGIAEDLERDLHAAKLRLAAEMHSVTADNNGAHSDPVAHLKEENERLKLELRELKQNLDKAR